MSEPLDEATPEVPTLSGKFKAIADKVMPGVIELLEEDTILLEVNLSGALNTTIFGVSSSAASWYDEPAAADALIEVDGVWASRMLAMQPLTMRKLGNQKLITTSTLDNFFANNQRNVDKVDLFAKSVSTGNHEPAFFAAYLKRPTLISASYSSTSIGGIAYASDLPVMRFSVDEKDLNAIDGICSMLGYKYAKGTDIIGTHYKGSFGFQKVNLARMYSKTAITGGSTTVDYISNMKTMYGYTPPGIKYLAFTITYNGQSPNTEMMASAFGEADVGHNDSGAFVVMIPVVDDGTNYVLLHSTYYERDVKKEENLWPVQDSRYRNDSNVNAIKPEYELWQHVVEEDFNLDLFGNEIDLASLPSYDVKGLDHIFGLTMLPILVPPLEDQHYVLENLSFTDEAIIVNEKNFTLRKVEADVKFFATKMRKSWYEEYYTSGFGLYKPKSSSIQKNILDKWNTLEFDTFSIVLDRTFSRVNSDIVYDTDLARSYADARGKACKTNDWLTKPFTSNLTYGDIRSRIAAQPILKGFYHTVNPSGVEYGNPFGSISWKLKGDAKVADNYIRTPVEGYAVGGYDSKAEQIVVETLMGCTANFTVDEASTNLEVDTAPFIKLKGNVDDIESNAYLAYDPDLKGYTMAEQYYTPEEALSMSGYPIYRYMDRNYGAVMIMRMYADLKNIGDPLVRIIESFTGEALAKKMLSQ